MSKANLTTKDSRARLAKQPEPHWARMRKGAYLGLYRGKLADAWRARYRMPDGKQLRNESDELASAPDYDTAKAVAEAWFAQLGGSGMRTVKRGTVREAIEAGIAQLRAENRGTKADADTARFTSILWGDTLADLKFENVTQTDVEEWRTRLQAGKTGKRISPATVNDYLRFTKTAVRRAIARGYTGPLNAWLLKPLANHEKKLKSEFLNAGQRGAIIASATPELAALLRAMDATGARPHELAKATVADFNAKRGTVRLSHRKGDGSVRERDVVLGPKGRAVFAEAALRAKFAKALLFPSPYGNVWTRAAWAEQFRAAVAKHHADGGERLPACRAYSFRHAHISEAIQLHGFDVMTVADQHGTSVKEIQDHYFRLIDSAIEKRLAMVG